MAQISRAYKFEIPILIRVCYNNYKWQRRDSNYYEVLRITPNATQKEIKDAYIKLSKETHPDAGKKGNHADFVKINEAYNALNKRKSKKYDVEFKYSGSYATNAHHYYYHYYRYDNASRHWEECNMQYKMNKEVQRKKLQYCVWLMIVGLFIEALYITTFLYINRRSVIQKSMQHQLEYLESLKEYENKTMEEKFLRIKDLVEKHRLSTPDE